MSKSLYTLLFALILLSIGCEVGAERPTLTGNPPAEVVIPQTDPDPEIDAALKTIARMPNSPLAYNNLAILHIKNARRTGDVGLYKNAEAALLKALEVAPEDGGTRKLRAALHLTFHRFPEALELASQLKKEYPTDAFIYGVLTDANLELGRYDEAVQAAQQMVDLRPNSSSYARVAKLRSLYGDHPGSVEMYRTAARTTDPADKEGQSWCLVQLGDEYFRNGKLAEAEKVYDEALANMPDYHMAVAAKGKLLAAKGDLAGGEELLARLLQKVPNVDTAIVLGDIYSKKGDGERAKTQYELAVAMDQKIGTNNDQKRIALLWADQGVRLNEAVEIAVRESAVRNDIYTLDALAWALYKSGRNTEAKEAITKATRLKGSEAKMLYHAGMIENALGNRAEAVKHLSAALKRNPSFDVIQADIARQTLDELKGTGRT
ncbi:MAG: tetratricopeptide repeat protein [Pyrinomonadaceae bacterium]